MPAKTVKLYGSGRMVEVKSIRLPNGSLLIPERMPHDRTSVHWVMVKPGTSLFKRWAGVAVDEPDPRQNADYKAWLAAIHASAAYREHPTTRQKK